VRGETLERTVPAPLDAATRCRRIDWALTGLLAGVMLTTFVHPYLFRRDEPREAEIARETLVNGHWVTPHLCGLPFLEKPPLYYDLVAAAYAVTGSITPPVARFVSIAFGALAAVTVLTLGHRWGGARRGWLAALILMGMPEFHKYSHLIVLDIAVAAFVILAMAAFVWWAFRPAGDKRRTLLLSLFYLACAGAFLTKGLAGVFHIAVTVTAFCLITRRWSTFIGLFRPLPMLLFAAPVGLWLLLFYREGGIPYLHEHFVNNIIGRLLGTQFHLPGVRFDHADVGTPRAWHFYLGSLPRTLGLALPVLPFALWAASRRNWQTNDGQSHTDTGSSCRDLPLLLVIWTLLPPFLLSFASNKETSYILSSCAGAALLAAWWLDERVLPQRGMEWRHAGWLGLALPAVVMNIVGLRVDSPVFTEVSIAVLVVGASVVLTLLARKKIESAAFASVAVAMCLTVLTNSPAVDVTSWGFGRELSRCVWSRVGQADLYLYRPDDVARGCIPFYHNRLTREIDRAEDLQKSLASGGKTFVLMRTEMLDRLRKAKLISKSWSLHALPDLDKRHRYVLVSNTAD
jgi:4-amino-4-deoxy-L-arabinose transferase-like glycosyltransferase